MAEHSSASSRIAITNTMADPRRLPRCQCPRPRIAAHTPSLAGAALMNRLGFLNAPSSRLLRSHFVPWSGVPRLEPGSLQQVPALEQAVPRVGCPTPYPRRSDPPSDPEDRHGLGHEV